jgi:hypothetical protein
MLIASTSRGKDHYGHLVISDLQGKTPFQAGSNSAFVISLRPPDRSHRALVANATSAVMAMVSRHLSHDDHAIADAQRTDVLQTAPRKPEEKTPLRMVAE